MKGWVAWSGLVALGGTQMGGCEWTAVTGVVVANDPGAFSSAVSGSHYTGKVDQSWTCDAPQARVRVAAPFTTGRVDILVYDAAGTLVYANTHGPVGGLGVQTRTGVPGAWRVVLDYFEATVEGAVLLEADLSAEPDRVWIETAVDANDLYTFHAGWEVGRVHVSVDGLSSGSVTLRLWQGGKKSDLPFFERTAGPEGLNVLTPAGLAGTWTVEVGFSDASLAGLVYVAAHR